MAVCVHVPGVGVKLPVFCPLAAWPPCCLPPPTPFLAYPLPTEGLEQELAALYCELASHRGGSWEIPAAGLAALGSACADAAAALTGGEGDGGAQRCGREGRAWVGVWLGG